MAALSAAVPSAQQLMSRVQQTLQTSQAAAAVAATEALAAQYGVVNPLVSDAASVAPAVAAPAQATATAAAAAAAATAAAATAATGRKGRPVKTKAIAGDGEEEQQQQQENEVCLIEKESLFPSLSILTLQFIFFTTESELKEGAYFGFHLNNKK